MISDKIKALFQFIEFLHSNTKNFKQYDEVIDQLYALNSERSKVNPRNNFSEKLKYDEVQEEIKRTFKIIQDNVVSPIKDKAKELNICSFENEPLYSWRGVESDIFNLKENFSKDDIPKILSQKGKYIEFRTETNCTYFQDFFFSELDEVLKGLFDFFKETDENEFEAFETTTVQVDSIDELVDHIQRVANNKKLPDPFSAPYNGMFTISKTKTRFKLKNGSIERRGTTNDTFDLINSNLYDIETGELIEVDVQSKYNTVFLLKLGKMYTPNVKSFLTHQLSGSSNPKEFMNYVRYCALDSEQVKSKGKYRAINDWLTEQDQMSIKGSPDQQDEKLTPSKKDNEKAFTLSQLALIHVYQGEVITRDNGGRIAKNAGYNSKTSGDKLYQHFTKFFNSADRKGDEGTKRKNQNKIKLIEGIIESLPKDKQQRAKDEVSILKSIQETQYQ